MRPSTNINVSGQAPVIPCNSIFLPANNLECFRLLPYYAFGIKYQGIKFILPCAREVRGMQPGPFGLCF